ncbi:MAG: oligosaccharide flippase family protein, partial [Lachnospiraceae bacterium]|nr:oligosaccharide flippase family protein [Lachnospiraceae bacterium]
MSAQLKKSLVVQGSILAIAGLITKVIGFIYRIPMANILGNVGNGLYSVAFGIYNIALTLSSYSMPLAVSKLMSARLAKGQYKNAYRLFRCALIFAIITGSIACCVLFFGAEFLA